MRASSFLGLALSVLLSLGAGSSAVGNDQQTLFFEVFDNTSGLLSNDVRRLHMDRDGLLWLATNNGLIRYDGYDFRTFRDDMNTPGLLYSNYVTTVSDDRDRVWIGTSNGVNYLDKSTQRIYGLECREFENVYINRIVPYGDRVWIATNEGLYSYETTTDSLRIHRVTDDGLFENVKDIILDSAGGMWVGVVTKGLFRYDFRTDRFVFYTKGNCSDFAHVLYEDKDGDLWIGSWGGGLTHVYNSSSPETAQYVTYRHDAEDPYSLVSDIVYSICQDRLSGDLWVGGRYGLSILKAPFNESHFERYIFDGTDYGLSNNDVSDICQDRNGSMWLATIGGGINKVVLRNSETIRYDPLQHVARDFGTRTVTAIYPDARGRLWLGLKNMGLVIYDPEKESCIPSREVPGLARISPTAKIRSIIGINGDTELLVGIENGNLYRVMLDDGNPERCLLIPSGPNSFVGYDYINQLFQDSRRRIWVSHGYEISLLDSTCTVLDRKLFKGRLSTSVTCFAEDSRGNIWAGSRSEGLLRIRCEADGADIVTYGTRNGLLNSNNVLSVLVDGQDNVWVGTQGGGLSRYEPKEDRFECVNDLYSIPYHDVFNIFEDRSGHIWLCSYTDVVKVGRGDDSKTELFASSVYPWKNTFYPECKVSRISDSLFAIGGTNGLNFIRPDKSSPNDAMPPLVITDILIGYNSIYKSPGDHGRYYDYEDGRLTLDSRHKDFSIEFASLSYQSRHNDQYAYRLLGYEKEWKYVGTDQRIASYTNLRKGRYVFQVKAAGANGVWSDTPEELEIRVLPSVFESWYAQLLYAGLFLLLCYYGYRMVANRIRLRNRMLMVELEKQKNEELTRSKLHFFTNISHEFLTPLTIIDCSTQNIVPRDDEQQENVVIIRNNVQRLQTLIHQVLDFNKAETGKLKLKVSENDLSEMIRSICGNDFSGLAQSRNIKLTCEIKGTVRGWYDADKVDKILINLLSNAFKYNYDNSFVQVSLYEDYDENHRYAVLSVRDGGIGIAPDKLGRIFDEYYAMDYNRPGVKGTGIGMALTKTLVELHKGTIRVESTLGSGTEFTVTIPINEKSYTDEERAHDNLDLGSASVTETGEHARTLLVVEDNDELRYLMVQYLSRYYAVDEASDGQAALTRMETTAYDLVVTDWMMPEMDGCQLCHHIKTNIDYSHIPVIMLTAKSSTEDKITGYDSGADAFITKPFQMPLLVARIENLLKSREYLINSYSKSDDSVQLQSIAYTSLDEKFIRDAVRIVEENISNEDFSLEDFVDRMNVSKSTLYRKIKSLAGMSTNEFIKDIRLKQACKMMRGQKMSVSEVAYTVGFSQPKYFTYCFKKKFGVLPTEYMERYEKDPELLE